MGAELPPLVLFFFFVAIASVLLAGVCLKRGLVLTGFPWVPWFSWLLLAPGSSWLLPACPRSFWLFLAPPGSSWLLPASPRSFRLFLAPPGSPWLSWLPWLPLAGPGSPQNPLKNKLKDRPCLGENVWGDRGFRKRIPEKIQSKP